jgi:hypothetical protein
MNLFHDRYRLLGRCGYRKAGKYEERSNNDRFHAEILSRLMASHVNPLCRNPAGRKGWQKIFCGHRFRSHPILPFINHDIRNWTLQ